jgi:hypothetical protein
MPTTIAGHQFEIPEAVLAKYAVGYTLSTEGEVNLIRQTITENLRNNFASKVKAVNGGELTDEQHADLQRQFGEYAEKYEPGTRTAGAPRVVRDPVEREMLKLAKDAISRAYMAKYNEKIDKDLLADKAEELLQAKHDEYAKRARAIIKQREQAGADDLASVGL